MATIDASIPLAAGNIGANSPQNMMSMAQFAMAMNQQKQKQQAQNALRSIFADQASMDATGNPTPEALNRVMQIDPAMGMQLRGQIQSQQMHQAGMDEKRMQILKMKMDMGREGSEAALLTYDQAIDKGIPEAQARALAQETYSGEMQRLSGSGVFSEEEVGKFNPTFDPNRARANVIKYKDWLAVEEKKKADKRAEDKEAETERHNRETERHQSASERRMAEIAAGGSKPPAGYRYNKDKPGELEPIPGGPAFKGGTTIGGKMNPAMRASVELDMKEINYGLDQIEKLKTDKASAFFGDEHEGNALTRFFKRKVTPEQQQEYDALANRFAMAIASIQSMGRGVVSDAKINEAKKLVPVPGDAKGAVETKLKVIRRIVTLAKESLDTPLKGGDRTDADDVQDAVDFSYMWK
ncbi:MAG: hypothetical protein KGP14_01780 [Betaproteobacteria bacterium]|nr:hypothetical protein [Betaproteobacteria bacterium]